jgi:hypothetical protein
MSREKKERGILKKLLGQRQRQHGMEEQVDQGHNKTSKKNKNNNFFQKAGIDPRTCCAQTVCSPIKPHKLVNIRHKFSLVITKTN